MKTVSKINQKLVAVNKAKVAEITSLKNTEEKFLDKNMKAYADVAKKMKKADEAHLKALKKFSNDASCENAHYVKVSKNELNSCVEAYNHLTQNINGSIDTLKDLYEQLNAAVAVVDPLKAAKQAEDFIKYNAKVSRAIGKIKDSLSGCPHN